jgi:hypothetical protein
MKNQFPCGANNIRNALDEIFEVAQSGLRVPLESCMGYTNGQNIFDNPLHTGEVVVCACSVWEGLFCPLYIRER